MRSSERLLLCNFKTEDMTVLEQRAYEAICDMARSKRGEPGYWDQLKHQYTGLFMKSFLDHFDGTVGFEELMEDAIKLSSKLVEKLKEG